MENWDMAIASLCLFVVHLVTSGHTRSVYDAGWTTPLKQAKCSDDISRKDQ